MSSWYRKGASSNNRDSQGAGKKSARRRLCSFLVFCALTGTAAAQNAPTAGGLAARLDFTQRLEFSDNPEFQVDGESQFYGRTVLNFGLESTNSVERLTFNGGLFIDVGRTDRDTVDFRDPFVSFGYRREVPNSFLDARLRYRRADPRSVQGFDQDGNSISQLDGTRDIFLVGLAGAVGRTAPVGGQFDWSYEEIRYNDTTDPTLNDRSDNRFTGQVDFRLNPKATANVNAFFNDFKPRDAPLAVARRTVGVGVGTELQFNRIWSADGLLRYDQIDRSGAQTGTTKGYTVEANVLRALTNGTVGLGFRSEVSSNFNGRRNFLAVSRDLALPRGSLAGTLGVTGAGDIIGTDPIVEVDYRYDLPAAALTFGVSRRIDISNENDERINTTARFGYDQRINNLSSLGLNITLLDRKELSLLTNDAQRLNIDLSYRYALTRDWGVVAGYRYSFLREELNADRRANTVFVGLQRAFNWLP